ncbi:conserved hypothetical protein [Chlorobaculum parvum NCIB 8327]|uniref:Uncharacterized protein n=2 Tax=Chlorobaculum parvum TaxID=274539 RepID=B3QM70_CHLP8|nr:conserved hypothetical protein [Chlorobaculum parvum NCIB 8327]
MGTNMTPIIRLKDVIEGIHAIDDEVRGFLNVRTGRVVMLSVDDLDAAANGSPENAMAQEVLRSSDYRELPDQFEVDDYSIMQQFCETVDDDPLRRGLLRSMQGRGASMRIRHTVHEYGVEEAWSAFRKEALRPIAIEWLEKHELDSYPGYSEL